MEVSCGEGDVRMNRENRLPTKDCRVCGRPFEWRKKWQRDWSNVRHCSKRCAKKQLTATDRAVEQSILECLDGSHGKISGVALFKCILDSGLRVDLERVKSAARRLANQERLVWIKKGGRVDAHNCTGPFELRSCKHNPNIAGRWLG